MKKILFALFLVFSLIRPASAGVYEDMLQAIKIDDAATVSSLLQRGMDVNTVSPQGETLLMLAAREGNPGVVKALLAARPRLDRKNPLGESALMLAAIFGHTQIVTLLLDSGAPVNQSGWTPLIYAAARNQIEVARLLVTRGADVDASSDSGTTALMMAAREGHLRMVLLLLELGADARLTNDQNQSALTLAQGRGHDDVVSVLRRIGAPK